MCDKISFCWHYTLGTMPQHAPVKPRVDAQVRESRTGIGGWFPQFDTLEVDRCLAVSDGGTQSVVELGL